jgi:hypothetical protein
VLLDVMADAYLCVPNGRDRLGLSVDRLTLAPGEGDTLSALREAGLVVETDAPPRAPRPLSPPRRDLPDAPRDRITAAEAVCLVAAVCDLIGQYRGRRFDEILANARRRAPAVRDPGATAATLRLARLFQRFAVWLPMSRKCLVRSFVLLRFLQRCGADADWVFGVRVWPFSAHCWLQLGETALDDTVARLCAYQPILSAA